ncbi:LysR family transcriptional regulator [Roseibium aggregatum]|uniref:LysR family transcriptional regulator n=1 Tax=Roseibium aggregatum TaxID=187304 RepID=UPI001E3DF7CD|nr:LysR family transcriptional regulator [Roseibium aggregatum]UES36380.1 LysR family transcriptional regulator [Roseibium aggregatum]UES41125.1 LysR family transcriptional regulator [Roseibium aggregatum]
MQAYRKSLPPLDTLVFFEAAMRHLNFTEAAEELFVTQAAVSKRIRQLEDWLGVDLFERSGRRLQPTEAGTYLAEKTGMTLDYLTQALSALKVPERPVVRIASVTALAAFWLQPKLKEFALSDEACLFNLATADDLGDLLKPEHDLVILHGDGRFPGWQSELLFQEVLTPVGMPEIIEALRSGGGGKQPALLNYPRLAPNWIDWTGWIQRTGRLDLKDWPLQLCASYNQSVGRALKGIGIALGALPLLREEIASGRLVPLEGATLRTGMGYYIAWPNMRPLGTEAERLKSALLEAG